MKKIIVLLGTVLLMLFISCKSSTEILHPPPIQNLSLQTESIFSLDSTVYCCAEYTFSNKKTNYKKKEDCCCFTTLISLLEWKINLYSIVVPFRSGNTIIIWNKEFVFSYILPLFKKEESRKIIEYTLAHSNDSTFTAKNVIDYENKVIINDKMYYYPLKIKKSITVEVDIEWFKSTVPQSSWIYEPSCSDVEKGAWISLLIPLLDEDSIPQ